MAGYIDAHVHVWEPPSAEYPDDPAVGRPEWMRPARFDADDILRHARPSGVERVVLIQMSNYGTDNRYMCDTIARHPGVFRGVAQIDHRAPPDAVGSEMRRLKRLGVRGFRITQVGRPGSLDPAWLEQPGMEAMLRCAAEERMAICPLIEPAMLGSVGRACARFPDTTVVIDHFARIGGDGQFRHGDIEALTSLARHPNAYVKVSALYALGLKRPPHHDLAPLIRAVYDAFGPRRMMWASDCPFQVASETYEDSIALVRDRLPFLSADNKDWILRRTAERVFFA